MKKRILGILLCLCMVLALCPVTAFAEDEPTIAVTIDGFEVGKTPNDCKYTFESNIPGVTFSEDDIEDIEWEVYDSEYGAYDYWDDDWEFEADTGYRVSISLDNKGLSKLPVITVNGETPYYCGMGYVDGVPYGIGIECHFDATFEPTIAVTIDGFEVGKTPNDCKLSFESNIPGVTFSEEDIKYIGWYVYYSEHGAYEYWGDDWAFEADTGYRVSISLDNNGLSKLPVITVNGETPYYCGMGTVDGVPYAINIDCRFDAPAEPEYNLDVTIDGFEVGKTPNDCKLSFESNIPGVTFSEEDIKYIWWYVYDSEEGYYKYWGDDWEFEADKGYRVSISLDNNGLSKLPVITVNGETPYYCEMATVDDVPYAINIDCRFDAPAEPAYNLDVTIGGFEVGKTPNDCKLSFESNIPGVTFSEEDIVSIEWASCPIGGSDYNICPDNQAFRADRYYQILLWLDNKGLSKLPVITVNGKTPWYCELVSFDGVSYIFEIQCDLGTPALPPIIINGPDVVCAKQDYEFTVTPPEGVTCTEFAYGDTGRGTLTLKNGVLCGVIPASEYNGAGSLELTVSGTTAGGTTVSASKTFEISPEHIFVNGVCGCGYKKAFGIAKLVIADTSDSEKDNPGTGASAVGDAALFLGAALLLGGCAAVGAGVCGKRRRSSRAK